MKKQRLDLYSAFYPMSLLSYLFGLFPITRRKKRQSQTVSYARSWIAQVYSFIVILTTGLAIIASYKVNPNFFSVKASVGSAKEKSKFIFKCEYVTCGIIWLCIAIFCFTCSSPLIKVFSAISKVDNNFKPPNIPKDIRLDHQSLRNIAYLQIFIVLILTAIIDYLDYQSLAAGKSNGWVLFPIYFLRLFSFLLEQQFVQLALNFRKRFMAINSSLESAQRERSFSGNVLYSNRSKRRERGITSQGADKMVPEWTTAKYSGSFEFSAEALERLRCNHLILSESISTFSNTYQLPLLADLIELFFEFLVGGYFQLSEVLNKNGDNVMECAWLWLISSAVRIALLSWTAWDTCIKAKAAGPLLVKSMSKDIDYKIKDELNLFLAQLGQNEVRFDILGLFYLDMTLPQAIIQAAASYLVVLLQFQTTS